MCKLKRIKTVIVILLLALSASFCIGCSAHKTSALNEIKSNSESCLIQNGYKVETSKADENEFLIRGEKDDSVIKIECLNVREDYQRCTITADNAIGDYKEKYKGIDYKLLSELSQTSGMKRVNENTIKKACEDERDFYDSSDNDYHFPSDKIMSKIYRVGFFENPVIMYELSPNTETVTILWNS